MCLSVLYLDSHLLFALPLNFVRRHFYGKKGTSSLFRNLTLLSCCCSVNKTN